MTMKKCLAVIMAAATLTFGVLAAVEATAKPPVRICIPTLSGGRLCWISYG
jgi:hypothetical protein